LKNYSLRGYYGDYFVNLMVYFKRNGVKILELPFQDGLRASGFSKTVVKINFRYFCLCLRYLLALVKNLFFRFF